MFWAKTARSGSDSACRSGNDVTDRKPMPFPCPYFPDHCYKMAVSTSPVALPMQSSVHIPKTFTQLSVLALTRPYGRNNLADSPISQLAAIDHGEATICDHHSQVSYKVFCADILRLIKYQARCSNRSSERYMARHCWEGLRSSIDLWRLDPMSDAWGSHTS